MTHPRTIYLVKLWKTVVAQLGDVNNDLAVSALDHVEQ